MDNNIIIKLEGIKIRIEALKRNDRDNKFMNANSILIDLKSVINELRADIRG